MEKKYPDRNHGKQTKQRLKPYIDLQYLLRPPFAILLFVNSLKTSEKVLFSVLFIVIFVFISDRVPSLKIAIQGSGLTFFVKNKKP